MERGTKKRRTIRKQWNKRKGQSNSRKHGYKKALKQLTNKIRLTTRGGPGRKIGRATCDKLLIAG